jgi:hypothetical protein
MDERSRDLSTSDIAEAAERSEPPERNTEPPESDVVGRSSREESMEHDDREADERSRQPLFPAQEAEGYRGRWESVQTAFVDHPQQSVEAADRLVADVLKRVAEIFSSGRETLEATWARGEDASTEDLRLILQRYRSFFNRLLSA